MMSRSSFSECDWLAVAWCCWARVVVFFTVSWESEQIAPDLLIYDDVDPICEMSRSIPYCAVNKEKVSSELCWGCTAEQYELKWAKKKHDTLAMVPCRRTTSSRNSWRRKCTMFACFLCRKTIYLLRSSRATSAPAGNKQIKQNSDTSLPAWFTENPPNALSELILKYIPLLFRPN